MKFLKENKDLLVFGAGIGLYAVIMFLLHAPCPIRFFTGLSCPGCGMTRALFSAVTLDFSAAFKYHPLWFLLPPAIFALVVLRNRNRRIFTGFLIVCCIVMIVTYVVRIAIGSPILSFDLADGFFVRIIQKIVAAFK